MLPGVWPRRWMTEISVAPTGTASPLFTRVLTLTGSSPAPSGGASPLGPGRRLHLGQGLPVIPVPVRGDDPGHRRGPDDLQQRGRIVGRVDEHGLTGLAAGEQVGVVIH